MNERICVYPGSFDPVTVGHVDIIRRAAACFDRVIVAVGVNPAKQGCFPVEERLRMLRRVTEDLPGVTVEAYTGLTVRFAQERGASVLLRGLRSASDFDAEWALAAVNRSIAPQIETVFLMAAPAHGAVSSSAVREMASFGADLSGYVPDELISAVRKHFSHSENTTDGGKKHGDGEQ